jgi:sec-independent protein translocase protein TatB
MFDIGFSELMVIGVVALLVIGPEKLPRVARTLGHLLGRAQRYVNDVKSDINREIQLDELKKLQSQVTDSARAIEESVRKEYDAARQTVEAPAREAGAEFEAASAAVAGGVAANAAPAAAMPDPAPASAAPPATPGGEPARPAA